jgi:hypothetical protein
MHNVRSPKLVERYYPQVPVHGEFGSLANGSLICYFTDWIYGTTPEDDAGYIETSLNETLNGKVLLNITLPEGLVHQLTEFMYNVTRCQIPEKERDPFQVVADVKSSMVSLGGRCYPKGSLRFPVDRLPEPASWARARLIHFRKLLSLSTPTLENITALDLMILQAWAVNRVKDPINQKYVLHYWDLRAPNISLDDNHTLAGYTPYNTLTSRISSVRPRRDCLIFANFAWDCLIIKNPAPSLRKSNSPKYLQPRVEEVEVPTEFSWGFLPNSSVHM